MEIYSGSELSEIQEGLTQSIFMMRRGVLGLQMMEDVSLLLAQVMSMMNIPNVVEMSVRIIGEHILLNLMGWARLSGRVYFLRSKYQKITMIGLERILTLQMMEVQ